MLFGNRKPPQGLLGALAQPGRMGMFEQQPQQMPQMQPEMQRFTQPHEAKGPGFFQQGGTGRAIAGALGDALAQMGGVQPLYAPAMQQRQMMQQRQQMAQQEREGDWQDFQRQEDYKRANPSPVNNDTVNDYNFILAKQGPEAANQYLRNLADPTVTVPMGNTIYSGPRSGLGAAMQGGQPQGPKPGTVEEGYRFKGGNAADPTNWEPVGGGAGNGTGGFPVAQGNFGTFSKAIIGQESGGRYGVANTEGSGARGIGQIMPDTAKSLSRKLGVPYRPDLLAGTSPEAQQYQNTLTNAALQEAWNYGGGDVRKAAAYYFAGPDRKGWGPKTRRYGDDIVRRMGSK